MDLSKAFDSLNHELLLTKLKAHGLDSNSVTFKKNYLTSRLQRCKINNYFSEWGKVINAIPQGTILGPLLFNIFLNDIFKSVTLQIIPMTVPCIYLIKVFQIS